MEKHRLTAVILAAGHGKRMKSPLPKVLHPVAGVPMIARIINVVRKCGAQEIRVVVGVGKDLIQPLVTQLGTIPFEQKEQLGTGHAVMSAGYETVEGDVLIMSGDHPLAQVSELQEAIQKYRNEGADLAVLSCKMKNPGEFGRIVRHKGQLKAIVEAKDASKETLSIREVNTGIYIVSAKLLKKYLPELQANNKQGEIYLTDIVSLAVENKHQVTAIPVSLDTAFGVNDQAQLSKATKRIVQRKVKELLENGVMFINPETVYIEDSVSVGAGTVVYPGVFLKGKTHVGSYCVLEPNCFVMDSEIEDSVQIKVGSYIDGSKIKTRASIGPYAHIRPECEIGEEAKIGNFVETKKVQFGKGAKASHLTYLGDATIGEGTNIGCGTITCNYAIDKKKYKTEIGKNVFVGSDTQFIAPVKIGDNAVIGSGSTITKDVPANALAVARGRQIIKEDYNK